MESSDWWEETESNVTTTTKTFSASELTTLVVYAIVIPASIVGNFIICFVIGRNKAMQSVTNLFLVNLAFCYIMECVLTIFSVYQSFYSWVFGEVFCYIFKYSIHVCDIVPPMTLIAIAIERFFVIEFPTDPRMKVKTCFLIIGSIWLLALIVSVPWAFASLSWYKDSSGQEKFYCESPTSKSFGVYEFSFELVGYFVPFSIIVTVYITVCLKTCKTRVVEGLDLELERRINRVLIITTAAIGLSHLPGALANLTTDLLDISAVTFNVLVLIAKFSFCYPFLFKVLLDVTFRKELSRLFCCSSSENQSPDGRNQNAQEAHAMSPLL